MNIQAMMKQAQKMQNDMMNIKNEIDSMEFIGTNGLVTAKVNGKKEIIEVKIKKEDDFSCDDFDMIEDMIVLAINDAIRQIDKVTQDKMGQFGSIPGLF